MSALDPYLQNKTFNIESMSHILYRNADSYEIYKQVESAINEFPNVKNDMQIFEQNRSDCIKKAILGTEDILENGKGLSMDEYPMECSNMYNWHMCFEVSFLMSKFIIEILGNETQKNRYLHPLASGRLVAPYCQTEMAHGTDVQNILTTAVYDKITNSFTFNTPSLESLKWWPGELSVYGTHCILMAQLYSNGKCYGPTPFFFQIRDMNTHKVLPGIEIGDIGPKFSWNTKDNGFMRLTNVKRGFDAMVNKFLSLKPDGSFEQTGNDKIMYAGMMRVRTSLLSVSSRALATSLTVAIRYSYFRKQFYDADGQENYLMKYQTHRNRLFPLLAQLYAMTLANQEIVEFCDKLCVDANKGDFSLMQEGHI